MERIGETDTCCMERFEFEKRIGQADREGRLMTETEIKEYDDWYNAHCKGCKYESEICMKGE